MQRKQLEYKTLHHLTTSSMLCYSSKYKQTEIKANHYQTGLSPHSALPIRGKTNKQTLSESEITQSCPTLCDPMNRSTPGLPIHHQLPEFTQTHGHRVRDAIQPSHPLSSPSPPSPIPPSIRIFSSESTLRMRWPNY